MWSSQEQQHRHVHVGKLDEKLMSRITEMVHYVRMASDPSRRKRPAIAHLLSDCSKTLVSQVRSRGMHNKNAVLTLDGGNSVLVVGF